MATLEVNLEEEVAAADNSGQLSTEMLGMHKHPTPLTKQTSQRIVTMQLNPDIRSAYAVALSKGWFDKDNPKSELSKKDRTAFPVLVIVSYILQFAAVAALTVELFMNPGWKEDSFDTKSSWSAQVVVIKIIAIISVAIYCVRSNNQTRMLKFLGYENADFRPYRRRLIALWIANVTTTQATMFLSVIFIASAEKGFDALQNAVAITFILEIDDWLYYIVQSRVPLSMMTITYDKRPSLRSQASQMKAVVMGVREKKASHPIRNMSINVTFMSTYGVVVFLFIVSWMDSSQKFLYAGIGLGVLVIVLDITWRLQKWIRNYHVNEQLGTRPTP